MAGIEIRDYRGDFNDLADFGRKVWLHEYEGKTWIPIPDAAFMRWRVSPESGALSPVAYDGTKIVGSVFSFPHSLRIGEATLPVAIYTGFTVDADYRGVALALIQRLRQDNEERGVAFGIGMVLDDPTSASYRFWTKYAEAFPQNFQFIFNGGYWAKFLGPEALATAGIAAWERLASRMFGPLLRFTPYKNDPRVRSYRAADLDRCAQMLSQSTADFDWAMVWQKDQLAAQLDNPAYKTLVFERDGQVKGMVNYHSFAMHGRGPIKAAMIDIWADDYLSVIERARLLGHLCAHLTKQGVHAVIAPRSAMMPAAAFVANLFMPAPQRFRIGLFSTPRSVPVAAPQKWDLTIM
jgi:hypothetical protein